MDNDLNPRLGDPYSALLHHLTGLKPEKPRLKTPGNIWRKNHRTEIEDEVNRQAKAAGVPKNKVAPLRERVASKLYNGLGEAEKRYWAQVAKQDHDSAMEKWDKEVNGSPSTEPADLQKYVHSCFHCDCKTTKTQIRCIQGLPQLIQPILDTICAATGWKATFIAGGPEPAHGGRLNVLR